MTIKNITLRTGTTVPETVLNTTCIALSSLKFLDLYEAVEIARDPAHPAFRYSGATLQNLGLLDSNGTMHDITRDVILAATEGKDFGVHLVSPLEGA